ncbi:MAG: DUF1398 domain-containing protein [Bacteroidales bacterium]
MPREYNKFTTDQIEKSHDRVKSGADFPKYISEIKQMGVISFETWVKDSHTVYFGKDNYQMSSKPKYAELSITDKVDKEKFIDCLKIHQKGETDYHTFCTHCAQTGIEKWVVNLLTMSCIYYDKTGKEVLKESIPSI